MRSETSHINTSEEIFSNSISHEGGKRERVMSLYRDNNVSLINWVLLRDYKNFSPDCSLVYVSLRFTRLQISEQIQIPVINCSVQFVVIPAQLMNTL